MANVPILDNLITGTAVVYTCPYIVGAPTPLPADTVDEGVDWGDPWTYVGSSDQGVTFSVDVSTDSLYIEEQESPAFIATDTMEITLAWSSVEDTMSNIRRAYGVGSISTVSAGASQPAKTVLTLNQTLNPLTVGIECLNPAGFWRRTYVPKVISASKVDTAFRRAKNLRMYPTTLTAICAPASIFIANKDGVATS